MTVQGNSYYFIFEGIKKGDEVLEADKKNEVSKYKKEASLSEIQNKFSNSIDKYLNKIENFNF